MLNDVIMWFSSGGTKSVLHNDHIDNINCLFSGEKELYMVDKVKLCFYTLYTLGIGIFMFKLLLL